MKVDKFELPLSYISFVLLLVQLPEPLTGKTWKLEDFEPYPALLVLERSTHPSCICFLCSSASGSEMKEHEISAA